MCGLAGYLGPGAEAAEMRALASAMAATVSHRGPDDTGAWVDPDCGIALGHRRLAVIDLSSAGHQPMASSSGRWVLAYNGEIYNHLDLRSSLEAEGAAPSWRGHSDTETLLAAIDAWGVEQALRRSVGMFAIALWDRAERVLWLARDRMGEKPLYYGWQGDTFLFGSELKALRGHPSFAAGVDRDALALMLRHNYVPAPYSIHQGIRKLPPGTFLRMSRGSRDEQPEAYWSLAEVAVRGAASRVDVADGEGLVDRLDTLLGDAVRRQMLADVPLGSLLSGGIDSTLVTSLMQAHSPQAVKTFTIGFAEGEYDEAVHAAAIARHLGTEHTELRLGGDDALALVPELARVYDEPFADSSQLPSMLVMALARRHVTVALSGDGGDELFGGYNRYIFGPRLAARLARIPAPLRHAMGRLMRAVPVSTWDRFEGAFASRGIALPGVKMHKLGQRIGNIGSADDLHVALVSEWAGEGGLVHGAKRVPNLLDDRAAWPALQDPAERMMAVDALTYLPDDILVKVDRSAMAVSLETRAPFLDRDVVEFAWQIPVEAKLRDGKGKWPLRRLLDRYVPAKLLDRPKMGFGVPLDDWLRGPLREWAGDLLSPERLQREGFLDPAPITRTWQSHLRGSQQAGHALWSVLAFQSWLEAQRG